MNKLTQFSVIALIINSLAWAQQIQPVGTRGQAGLITVAAHQDRDDEGRRDQDNDDRRRDRDDREREKHRRDRDRDRDRDHDWNRNQEQNRVYRDRDHDRDRDDNNYYGRDNRAYGNGGYYRNNQWRGRLSAEDQNRFNSYYSRWLGYRRSNNQSEAASMDSRMRDVYNHYGIPNNVPFNQIASPGVGPIVAY